LVVEGEPHVGAVPAGGADGGAPHVGAAPAAGALAGAAGLPQPGDVPPGVTAGEAGEPQPPAVPGLLAVGEPHAFDEAGGATMVGATVAGRAGAGGAHVAATPAVWVAGAAGRTGGAAFFLRRRRVLR
jgi:hypothetical protein